MAISSKAATLATTRGLTALLAAAALALGGCSVLFDGSDLHGAAGSGGSGGGGADMGAGGAGGNGGAGGTGGAGDDMGSTPGGDMAHHLTLSFTPGSGAPVLVGGSPMELGVGDFDGDGKLDVVTANSDTSNLSFAFGDGKGGFTVQNVAMLQPPNAGAAGGCGAYAVVVGEFNGAPPIDVAATCSDLSAVNGGMVVLGDTHRTFTTKAITALQVTTAIHPQSITAGDFNHDGKLDIAVGVYTQPGKILLLHGKGDGTFDSAFTSMNNPDGGDIESVTVGDLNKDGRDDLIASNEALGEIYVYLQSTSGTFAATPVVYNGVSGTEGVQVADVDEDGWPDILGCDAANWGILVLINAKDGTFPTAEGNRSPPEYGDTSSNPWKVVIGDLDHDGHLDTVSTAYNASKLDFFLGLGDGTFPKVGRTVRPNVMEPNDVGLGDFNGDGLLDVVYIEGFNPGGVYLLVNTSN